ncbi:MAG: helix-turn-helix transcriptional regulator [Bacteroidales bacterium]
MIERIYKILQIKKLSPSQFADEIQVQRSGVSHILSGRNKPSLDFILKVLTSYPDIDADWLLFGKGKMIQKSEKIPNEDKLPKNLLNATSAQSSNQYQAVDEPSNLTDELKIKKSERKPDKNKSIEKIVVFNSDNTFKEYFPEN